MNQHKPEVIAGIYIEKEKEKEKEIWRRRKRYPGKIEKLEISWRNSNPARISAKPLGRPEDILRLSQVLKYPTGIRQPPGRVGSRTPPPYPCRICRTTSTTVNTVTAKPNAAA